MQSLGLSINTYCNRVVSTSVRGAILKYLCTLIVFTTLLYIQFTFNRVSLQTYGPATELCFLKKQLDSSAGRHISALDPSL